MKRRISRLLGTKQTRFAPTVWSGAAVLLVLIGVVLALGWPRSIAQEGKSAEFELRSVVESGAAGAEKLTMTRRGEEPTIIWVSKRSLMDKKYFASVEVKDDPISKLPQIWVRLTEPGAKLFGEITEQHVGKQIAIVIEGKVISAPRVNERIAGGSFMISGNFTEEEANALAEKLRPKGEKQDETAPEDKKSASGFQTSPEAVRQEPAGAPTSAPSAEDDTAEERALLQKEIELTKKEVSSLERARETGRVSWEELAVHQREALRLEYELAWLNKDSEGMIDALQKEISLLEQKIKIQRKKIEVGAVSSESLLPMERDVLRVQRELAATRKGRPPRPGRAAPAP